MRNCRADIAPVLGEKHSRQTTGLTESHLPVATIKAQARCRSCFTVILCFTIIHSPHCHFRCRVRALAVARSTPSLRCVSHYAVRHTDACCISSPARTLRSPVYPAATAISIPPVLQTDVAPAQRCRRGRVVGHAWPQCGSTRGPHAARRADSEPQAPT